MIRLRYRKPPFGGWILLTARDEAEAERISEELQAAGYQVERLS